MKLWLVGMMGSGKTSVGRHASRVLGVGFVDTDESIELEAGLTISQIWDRDGEAGFRQLESDSVRLAAAVDNTIVATGGGVVISEDNRMVLTATGTVVWLKASPEIAIARISPDEGRPLLFSTDMLGEFTRLLDQRLPWFSEVADREIDTDYLSLDQAVAAVVSIWKA
jgi:shikimate kinase